MNQMLSEKELQELTGAQQPARQANVLDQHGIFYRRNLRGRIQLSWYSLNHPGTKPDGYDDVEPDYGAITRPIPKPPRQLRASLPRKPKNKALVCFHSAKRRTKKLQRTPAWVDLNKIRSFYESARKATKATGIQHVVDHIIPLQGEAVSGLHVPWNLQIITAIENSQKRNKLLT